MEPLRMKFPLSMSTERVEGGEFVYSKEAYQSIIDKLCDNIDIYSSLDDDAFVIGKVLGLNDTGDIEVEISNVRLAYMINTLGEEQFFVATAVDGDADIDSDGITLVKTAKLLKVAIISRVLMSDILFREDSPKVIVVKEPTL